MTETFCKNWNTSPQEAHLFMYLLDNGGGIDVDGFDELAARLACILYAYLRKRLPGLFFERDVMEASIRKSLKSFLSDGIDDAAEILVDRMHLAPAHSEEWSVVFYLVKPAWLLGIADLLSNSVTRRCDLIMGRASMDVLSGLPRTPDDVVAPEVRSALYEEIGRISGDTLTHLRDNQITGGMVRIFGVRQPLLMALANVNRVLATQPQSSPDGYMVLVNQRDTDGRMWSPKIVETPQDEKEKLQTFVNFDDIVPIFPKKGIQHLREQLQATLEEMGALVEITKDAERVVAVHAALMQDRSNKRLNFLFLLAALAQMIGLVAISKSEVSTNLLLAMLLNLGALAATAFLYKSLVGTG